MRKEIENKKKAEDYKSFERNSSNDSNEGMGVPVRVGSKSSVITEPYQQQWQHADVPSLFGGVPDHQPNSTLKGNLFDDDHSIGPTKESPKKKADSPKKKTVVIPVPKDTLLLSPRSEKLRLEKLKERYDQRVAQSNRARVEADANRTRLIDHHHHHQYQQYPQYNEASSPEPAQVKGNNADSFINELTNMSKSAINTNTNTNTNKNSQKNRYDDDYYNYSPNPKLDGYSPPSYTKLTGPKKKNNQTIFNSNTNSNGNSMDIRASPISFATAADIVKKESEVSSSSSSSSLLLLYYYHHHHHHH